MLLRKKNESGQAVLIILLSLSVVLIVVLYIMSRSVTDITLSSKDEDSMRAFSAAEAGVERALVIGSAQSGGFDNANFSATVTNFAQGLASVVYPIAIRSGELATFWFTRPSETPFSGNSIKVCWGTSVSEPPAIEISIFHNSAGEYRISRSAFEPNSGRASSNNFTIVSVLPCVIDGVTFQYQTTLNLSSLSNLSFMTVKSLYNTTVSTKVGIDAAGSGSVLPSQGLKVNSDGTFAETNRSIEVYQLYPVAPSVFMNTIYSSTGIVK